jgi:hypothetical protein
MYFIDALLHNLVLISAIGVWGWITLINYDHHLFFFFHIIRFGPYTVHRNPNAPSLSPLHTLLPQLAWPIS